MIKILINLFFAIVFHVKIQHNTTKILFCVVFALIKLSKHNIPEKNYRLNDTIIFLSGFVVSCRWAKKCYRRPFLVWSVHKRKNLQKPEKSLNRGKGMALHVQLSTYCGLGCLQLEKNIFQFTNSQFYTWLTTAQAA